MFEKYSFGFIIQEGNDILLVIICCKALEKPQKASVDSALDEFQLCIKSPMFSKKKALDYHINLKIVAKKTGHPKSGFFNAVLQAMLDKIRVPDVQFQHCRPCWAIRIMKRFLIQWQ